MSRFTPLAGSLVLLFAAAIPDSIVWAQRGSARLSASRARSHFDAMETAWRELRALEVQPADANGAVAAWDRAWARRVARAERDTGGACFALADDCASVEVYVLGCNMVGDVAGARASIFNPEAVDDHDPFAWRRAVADEAARRRAERLSCEDLPRVSWEVFQDACGRWYGTGGTPIVPDTSAPVCDWGRGTPPECPLASESPDR